MSLRASLSLIKRASKTFRPLTNKIARFKSTTDFGYQNVKTEQKESMVKDVFSKVAQNYDIMNDLMSLGIHRLWKDEFVSKMGLDDLCKSSSFERIPRLLDVAGGTGDIAFRAANKIIASSKRELAQDLFNEYTIVSDRKVVVCDINPDMLAVGKDRAKKLLGQEKSNLVFLNHTSAQPIIFFLDWFY
jgi:2-methoxy-6-polyprenyl-1,4-benzoquinol methylase